VRVGQAGLLAAGALLTGGAAPAAGELPRSAGSRAPVPGLAPEFAHGQYQGVFTKSTISDVAR
jgi:hypothetical protein